MASTTPSEKRATTPPDSDRAEKRLNLTMAEIKKGPVFMLYRNYFKNKVDAVDEDLNNFTYLCMRYDWIPTIDQVNFIIKEANFIDGKHRLEFPVYPFMQEFKFLLYVAPDTNQPRMLVGKVPFSHGKQEIWAGWSRCHPPDSVNFTTESNTSKADDSKSKGLWDRNMQPWSTDKNSLRRNHFLKPMLMFTFAAKPRTYSG
ncbi:hypothetical protein KCU64_g2300, partial [Aureobasidium melanogenum]